MLPCRLFSLRGRCLLYSLNLFLLCSGGAVYLIMHSKHVAVAEITLKCTKQVERGSAVYLSGLREKYFGEIFLNASTCYEDLLSAGKSNCVLETSQFGSENSFPNKFRLQRVIYEEGLNHIARYVESFESRSNEIWLVFSYEGLSLSKLLYTVEDKNGTTEKERLEQVKQVQILRPSKWWHWLKTTEEGQEEMRNLIWQLVCLQCRFCGGIAC